MVFKKRILLFLLVPSFLFAQDRKDDISGSINKDTAAIYFSKTITAENLKKHLLVLANDSLEGRETGKKGQKMAADYIQSQFRSFGISPYKNNLYYQTYSLNMVLPGPAEVSINGKKFIGNKDYYNFPGIAEQSINSKKVLFLGYGIEELRYNDYKETDVRGEVLMILSEEPSGSDGNYLVSGTKEKSLGASNRIKIESAKKRGARALLIVINDIEKGIQDNKHRLESPALKLDMPTNEMPVIYISKEMGGAILKKRTTEQIAKKIAESRKPLKIKAKSNIYIDIINEVHKVEAENVLGFIEGADLKEELIIVTAHYDHLGKDADVVFNGADDNGSGTSAVIEIAQAFSKAKKQGRGPRRSVLCMAVSGEEKGLLGSSYYVENPVFPLKNTVCDLNIDMIGRQDEKHANNPNYVYLIGSDKLSSQLHNISEQVNRTYTNLELDYTFNDEKDKNRFYYRSDHYNFAKNGIPVIFYFNGVHADYHKETDEVEKINFKKMEKITRLVFFTAWEIANENERIIVDSNKK